jgi:hypothetical protein
VELGLVKTLRKADLILISSLLLYTRATIKWNWFWKYVPTSEEGLDGNEGLIYTKGLAEVPIIQMAT